VVVVLGAVVVDDVVVVPGPVVVVVVELVVPPGTVLVVEIVLLPGVVVVVDVTVPTEVVVDVEGIEVEAPAGAEGLALPQEGAISANATIARARSSARMGIVPPLAGAAALRSAALQAGGLPRSV